MNPSAAMNMNYTSRVSTEPDNRDGAAAFTGYSAQNEQEENPSLRWKKVLLSQQKVTWA
jgi:hypothetical protein